MNLGRVGVVLAARMSSSRLPGKALLPLQGLPMILFLLRRLSALSKGDLVVATTNLPADDVLFEKVSAAGVKVFRGSSPDVVKRYCSAAEYFGFDTIARVTADCPFIDAVLVDH